jgi:diguanylate cyclase (GGDEF)-like protein
MEAKNNLDSKMFLTHRGIDEKLVYLITQTGNSDLNLANQIKHYGYQVQIAVGFNKLEELTHNPILVCIIIDLTKTDLEDIDWNTFYNVSHGQHGSLPIIFISDTDNQTLRLRALQAGGIAFFHKPVDVVNLVDKLDQISSIHASIPYRVLVIEDQPTIAGYYQMILKIAAMDTRVITDPLQTLEAIEDFHPDLILMDLYMPSSTGIELTKLIRQIDEYMGIPIVFLSSEADFSKQVEVMALGGDDFMTKPIKSTYLVSIVKNRLERLKNLRTYIVHDGLTRLLNHTSFRLQLVHEINRCKRQDGQLALAMLDIDHFKNVNDMYGHPTGDLVLKSLSLILKQRLRKSDIIGRYGGEEFAVLLLDQDGDSAARVINEIRNNFSEVRHKASQQELFSVSFSCGIATYPMFQDVPMLIEAADHALYIAKASGRNQVIVYEE